MDKHKAIQGRGSYVHVWPVPPGGGGGSGGEGIGNGGILALHL